MQRLQKEAQTMNEQLHILVQRLKEAEISTQRFLKVGPDKAAFEFEFQKKLYGPEDLDSIKPCYCKYCKGEQPHKHWGILGKEFLVLVDTDTKEMYDLLSKVLPETFEVTSPRRGLPHKYFCVCYGPNGEEVPNKTLYIEGNLDEKGRVKGEGEVRAQNEYLVAPDTEITFKDRETGEETTGKYTITKNIPIARLEYADFMAAVQPYIGKNSSDQKITEQEMKIGVGSGFRHAKTMSYAYHLIAVVRLGEALTLQELIRFGKLCSPPLEDQEYFKRAINAAIRKEAEVTGKTEQYFREGTELRVVDELIQTQEKKGNEREKKNESQADRVYKLFMATNAELFYDQNKTAYARIPLINKSITTNNNGINAINGILNNLLPSILLKNEAEEQKEAPESPENTVNTVNSVLSFETVRLKESKFKSYLAYLLYEAEGKVINNESVAQVLLLLNFEASQGKCYTLYNRVAPCPSGDGSIWLDMADAHNRAYHITKDGWTLESEVPILFRRYEHQKPLVVAAKNGDPKKLLKFVNIGANKKSEKSKYQQLLLLVQTASYIIPEIAHPVNAMYGGPGTHKSTAQRFIREVFDPSAAPLLRIPRDENSALQVLDHHYIPIFDNIDYLARWFSDMLCGAVTGTGQESRVLYSDDDSFIRSFRRCVMLNGLNLPTTKGDLVNRTILHPAEPDEKRLTEQELESDFKRLLPEILGGFLDVAVKALNLKDILEPSKLFRLADFTKWGYVLSEALGYGAEEFIKAMEENLNNQNAKDIENNVVADVFLAYCMENLDLINATEENPKSFAPEEVFKNVTARAEKKGVSVKNSKRWPSAANAFTRKLNESKTAIVACGWNYDIIHTGKKREMQIWTINKIDDKKGAVYEQIKPAEQCDFCRQNAVEFVISMPSGDTLRRCEGCFKNLPKQFQELRFTPKEAS